jgi:hypothetical protein
VRVAAVALTLCVGVGACTRPSSKPDAPASFDFLTRPPTATADGEIWEAIAAAPGDTDRSGPATFRLCLKRPGRHVAAGAAIHGVLRRGDAGGHRWFFLSFGPAFEPPGGSGGMTLEVTDSIPVTVRADSRTPGPWTGTVQLPNGGHFRVMLDSAGGRGAFSSIGTADNARVLGAIAGLIVPRGEP